MSKTTNIPSLRFSEFDGFWKINKVGELCDFIVPGRNKPQNFNGEVPWITTPDIQHNSIIRHSKSGLAISKEEAKKVGSKIVPKNSIIISCVGELGLAAITGNELVINQQLHAFIPKENIENRFLLYSVGNQKRYMDKVATKTAVPYMNKDNCNSIPISYPTLPEQQKIASFLTAVDTKIEQLTQKLNLLEEYKKGVMQQIFSQGIRFKDENGNDYPDWEEKKIGKAGSFYYGKSAPKWSISENGKTPCIRYGELYTKPKLVIDKIHSYTNIEPKNLKFSKGGEVLVPRVGEDPMDFSKCHFLPLKDIAIGEMISVYNTNENGIFITYYFNTLKKEFARLVEGGNVSNLYFRYLEDIVVGIPCQEEQTQIANFLSAIDDKIALVNTQLENTQEFKKGLLQQMFV